MPVMNFASKLPPAPVLLPGAALVFATLLLVATLLVQGNALRETLHSSAPNARSAAANNDAPLAPATPVDNLGLLADSTLFGHFDPAQAPSAAPHEAGAKPAAELGDKAPDALPEATLALKLQGIVFKEDPAQRRAIIAGDGPQAEARKIGETLLGDAVIRYIEARRVVVEQQGELKALSLAEPALGTGAAPLSTVLAPMPGGATAPFISQPAQAFRRGVMQGAQPAQTYEPPEVDYEPPPEDFDSTTQYEEPLPPDDAGEIDQSEPMQ